MPYERGTFVTERLAQPGETFYIIEYDRQVAPGGWATRKQYTSLKQARQELALLPEFKSGNLVVREYTVVNPMPVREGTVGSLTSALDGKIYAGGGMQTEFVFNAKKDWESYMRQTNPSGTPIR